MDSRPRATFSSFAAGFSERQLSALIILLFCLVYVTQTVVLASEKRLWFDELCTYFICRQPSFHDSWAAVLHGADFNPPLFYLIERAGAALFGFGLIGFRMPQILAFWLFCLCLFFVVRRFAGVAGGFIAMAFPLICGAYFYAYEARPHGLVLGFTGAALLCWSKLLERPRSLGWLVAFAACLEGAFQVHCYAVLVTIPFAIVQLVRDVRARRIEFRIWLAMALAGVVAVLTFLPLLRAFSKYVGTSNTLTQIFAPSLNSFTSFYQLFLDASMPVLLATLLVFAARQILPAARPENDRFGDERGAGWLLLLAAGFLGMPLYGILLANLVHGPFFARYFSSAAIGVAILLSFALYLRHRGRWSHAVTVFIALLVTLDAATVVLHRARGWGEKIIEPSSHYGIDTDPHNDLETYSTLTSAPASLPVALPGGMDYLYLLQYWPAQRSRLFFVIPSRQTNGFAASRGLFDYCHLPGNSEVTYDEFLRAHRDFLIYSSQMEDRSLPSQFVAHGAEILSFVFDHRGNYLAHMRVRNPGA